LSKDCESSIRAIVMWPPRLGVALLAPWLVRAASAAAEPLTARTSAVRRNANALRRGCTADSFAGEATVAKDGGLGCVDYPKPGRVSSSARGLT
jgi:hypothetical protein